MRWKWVVVLLIALTPLKGFAGTIPAASCSQSDVQQAINSASNGDTVMVPAGTCAWTAQVTIPDTKGLTLQGAGIDETIISGLISSLKVSLGTTTAVMRITGFTWTTTGISAIFLHAAGTSGETSEFRVDHNKITAAPIIIDCRCYGVIDHNTFTADTPFSSIFIRERSSGGGDGGAASWLRKSSLGSRDAVYIENNTFDFTSPAVGTSCVDGRSGGRIVVRYNTIKNSSCGSHDAENNNERGNRQYEFYNNTHTIDADLHGALYLHRGGTGVIHNNCFKRVNGATYIQAAKPIILRISRGTNAGTVGRDPWDKSACNSSTADDKMCLGGQPKTCNVDADCPDSDFPAPGSPVSAGPCVRVDGTGVDGTLCRDQLGAGVCDPVTGKHVLEPVYMWDNLECSSAASNCICSNPYSGVDVHTISATTNQLADGIHFFSNTQSTTWTEFTYPHPLVSEADDDDKEPPSPPRNLRFQ